MQDHCACVAFVSFVIGRDKMCKMPVKTYFVLMRGSKSSLLPIVLGTQHPSQQKPLSILMPCTLHMWRCRYFARFQNTLGGDGRLGC